MDNLLKFSDDGKTVIGVKQRDVTHIIIPNGVTEIGEGAFRWCSSLQSIDIPNSVTAIGESAFHGCKSLQSIDIPNSVTAIGKYAFWGCTSLQSIHLHWNQLDDIQVYEYSFDGLNTEECILYVPSGTRWEYRHHPAFSKFKNIEIEKKKP